MPGAEGGESQVEALLAEAGAVGFLGVSAGHPVSTKKGLEVDPEAVNRRDKMGVRFPLDFTLSGDVNQRAEGPQFQAAKARRGEETGTELGQLQIVLEICRIQDPREELCGAVWTVWIRKRQTPKDMQSWGFGKLFTYFLFVV